MAARAPFHFKQLASAALLHPGLAALVSDLEDEVKRLFDLRDDEIARLNKLINTPELVDFAKGVQVEAAHQIERHGPDHDANKSAADWFWLIGYLAQKAMIAHIAGDHDKALHHCITVGAAMANWHKQVLEQQRAK